MFKMDKRIERLEARMDKIYEREARLWVKMHDKRGYRLYREHIKVRDTVTLILDHLDLEVEEVEATEQTYKLAPRDDGPTEIDKPDPLSGVVARLTDVQRKMDAVDRRANTGGLKESDRAWAMNKLCAERDALLRELARLNM